MSSLHRATGIALSVGAIYLLIWQFFASASPRTYAMFQIFNVSILGRIFLGGWLFCIFYLLCNGIRHLFWDAGYGFELKDAYRSGWIVIVVSLAATIASWVVGLRLV